jgi:hypothetical protein
VAVSRKILFKPGVIYECNQQLSLARNIPNVSISKQNEREDFEKFRDALFRFSVKNFLTDAEK